MAGAERIKPVFLNKINVKLEVTLTLKRYKYDSDAI